MSFGWKHIGWGYFYVFPSSTFVLFNPIFIPLIDSGLPKYLISTNSVLISLHKVFPIAGMLNIHFTFN